MASIEKETVVFKEQEYNISELLSAIKKGNNEEVQKLIPKGIDTEDIDEFISLVHKKIAANELPDEKSSKLLFAFRPPAKRCPMCGSYNTRPKPLSWKSSRNASRNTEYYCDDCKNTWQ